MRDERYDPFGETRGLFCEVLDRNEMRVIRLLVLCVFYLIIKSDMDAATAASINDSSERSRR